MSIKATIRDAASTPRVRSVPNPKGPSRQPDVIVDNQGSIVLLRPETNAAKEWLAEHIHVDAMHFGPSLVVEWRYADDIIDGMKRDGLEVQ